MTPEEIYRSPAISTSRCLYDIVTAEILPEVETVAYEVTFADVDPNVLIKTHFSKSIPGEWGYKFVDVKSVWFKGYAVMVLLTSDEGRTNVTDRYITGLNFYRHLLGYVRSLVTPEDLVSANERWREDLDIPEVCYVV